MIVAIGDEWCALGSAVAHGEGEIDALEELFDFLVEGCTANDNLVGTSAKGVVDLLADTLPDFFRDDRHLEHNLDGVGLYLGEHALADNLLDNQGYCNDDVGLDFLEGLGNDGWRGQTREEVQVVTRTEGEEELDGHAVHVGHRQDVQHVTELRHAVGQILLTEVHIAPDRTVGQHDVGATGDDFALDVLRV